MKPWRTGWCRSHRMFYKVLWPLEEITGTFHKDSTTALNKNSYTRQKRKHILFIFKHVNLHLFEFKIAKRNTDEKNLAFCIVMVYKSVCFIWCATSKIEMAPLTYRRQMPCSTVCCDGGAMVLFLLALYTLIRYTQSERSAEAAK